MSLMVDPSLNWVFYIIAGDAWPQGDEDKARELAAEWDQVAQEISAAGTGFSQLAEQVVANVGGDVATNFADYANKLSTMGAGFSYRAQQQAAALREYALNVENAKYGILISIAVTAADLIWAMTNPFTAPLIPGIWAAGRTAVMQIERSLMSRLMSLLSRVAREAAQEAAEEAAEEMLAEFIQIAQGNRDGFDWKQIGQNAALGGIGGAFAAGAHSGLGKWGHNVFGAAGVEAATEVVVGLAGAGLFGGDLDSLGWGALNGGLTGAATHGAHHAGENLHNKLTGGGDGGGQAKGPYDPGGESGTGNIKVDPVNGPSAPGGSGHPGGPGDSSGSGSPGGVGPGSSHSTNGPGGTAPGGSNTSGGSGNNAAHGDGQNNSHSAGTNQAPSNSSIGNSPSTSGPNSASNATGGSTSNSANNSHSTGDHSSATGPNPASGPNATSGTGHAGSTNSTGGPDSATGSHSTSDGTSTGDPNSAANSPSANGSGSANNSQAPNSANSTSTSSHNPDAATSSNSPSGSQPTGNATSPGHSTTDNSTSSSSPNPEGNHNPTGTSTSNPANTPNTTSNAPTNGTEGNSAQSHQSPSSNPTRDTATSGNNPTGDTASPGGMNHSTTPPGTNPGVENQGGRTTGPSGVQSPSPNNDPSIVPGTTVGNQNTNPGASPHPSPGSNTAPSPGTGANPSLGGTSTSTNHGANGTDHHGAPPPSTSDSVKAGSPTPPPAAPDHAGSRDATPPPAPNSAATGNPPASTNGHAPGVGHPLSPTATSGSNSPTPQHDTGLPGFGGPQTAAPHSATDPSQANVSSNPTTRPGPETAPNSPDRTNPAPATNAPSTSAHGSNGTPSPNPSPSPSITTSQTPSPSPSITTSPTPSPSPRITTSPNPSPGLNGTASPTPAHGPNGTDSPNPNITAANPSADSVRAPGSTATTTGSANPSTSPNPSTKPDSPASADPATTPQPKPVPPPTSASVKGIDSTPSPAPKTTVNDPNHVPVTPELASPGPTTGNPHHTTHPVTNTDPNPATDAKPSPNPANPDPTASPGSHPAANPSPDTVPARTADPNPADSEAPKPATGRDPSTNPADSQSPKPGPNPATGTGTSTNAAGNPSPDRSAHPDADPAADSISKPPAKPGSTPSAPANPATVATSSAASSATPSSKTSPNPAATVKPAAKATPGSPTSTSPNNSPAPSPAKPIGTTPTPAPRSRDTTAEDRHTPVTAPKKPTTAANPPRRDLHTPVGAPKKPNPATNPHSSNLHTPAAPKKPNPTANPHNNNLHTPIAAPKKPAITGPGPNVGKHPPVTGGKGDFAQHLKNFKFTVVHETGIIGDLGTRNENNQNSIGVVATVAATPNDNLQAIAEKYSAGFTGNSSDGRFGLVIGINGTPGSEQAISQKIQQFQNTWDNRFPVAIIGFTWKHPSNPNIDQKTIPYGGIRETIVRNPVTEKLTAQIREAGGDNEVYLHTGDADVHSLDTRNGPLFDVVNTAVQQNPEGPPEVISGGYHVRPEDGDLANRATQLDLDVRQALAGVDSRSVYFPEPNTFVRMQGNKLENDATFGTKNPNTGHFDYGAKEGQGLVDSVLAQRNPSWQYSDHPAAIAKFSSDLAIQTDGSRIAGKVGTDPDGITALTQSHANETTWSDQIGHYLGNHTTLDPNLAKIAAKAAFHGITPSGPTPKRPEVFSEVVANLPKNERTSLVKGMKENVDDGKKLADLTLATRQALVDNLSGNRPANTQTPAAAPKNHTPENAAPKPDQAKSLPGPNDWNGRRDTAPVTRFSSERFDPVKNIAEQFAGNRAGLKGGQLAGAMAHIRFDVRRFEIAPGQWVREHTIPIDLTSHSGSVSSEQREQFVQNVQAHLDDWVNRASRLPGGDQLHVSLDVRVADDVHPDDTGWQADPRRRIPVNLHDSTVDPDTPETNQLNWDVHDSAFGVTHELMHFLGLGDGYKNDEMLFNREDQPGVMGPGAWHDSRLNPGNLAQLEQVSNTANIRDHHLGDAPAPHPRPHQDDHRSQPEPEAKPNLHTPVKAPPEPAAGPTPETHDRQQTGVQLDSEHGARAVRESNPKASASVANRVKPRDFSPDEKAAVSAALQHYAPIIGDQRQNSSRAGIEQEVQHIGAVNFGIENGQLSPGMAGEYIGSHRTVNVYAMAGFARDFGGGSREVEGMVTHELSHGLLKYALDDYTKHVGVWNEDGTPKRAPGAEPPTDPKFRSDFEDFAGSIRTHLAAPGKLAADAPRRSEFIKQLEERHPDVFEKRGETDLIRVRAARIAQELRKDNLSAFNERTGYWTADGFPAFAGERPITRYGATNPNEDMAEAAKFYFLDPDRLRAEAPQRAAFFDQLVSDWTPHQNDAVLVSDEHTEETPDNRPLSERLPAFVRDGKALGSVVPVDVRGAKDVGTSIENLIHRLNPQQQNPPRTHGVDAITDSLSGPEFESFMGDGRKSMVRAGEKWYEVHVTAEPDFGSVNADQIAKLPQPTIGDVKNEVKTTHASPNTDTTAKAVGTSYFAMFPAGPYASVGGTAQLASPSAEHTGTTTGTDQRVIRTAGDMQRADAPVTYRITVRNETGGLVGSTVDGHVGLVLSTDLANLKQEETVGPPEPKPDWAKKIEFLSPEALDFDENALFDQVSKNLHPSVTKFGAPGRTSLREFLSRGGVRSMLGTALQGSPVVSNDLLSPHGTHRDAVQLEARPTKVEYLGTIPGDSELRFNDSAVNGGSTTVSSKYGGEVNAIFGGGSYVPGTVGGVGGVSGSYSRKVNQQSTSGTSFTNKSTVNAKGDIGLYKVTVDLDVTTSNGEKTTVQATSYTRMGLPEAKAQGLPVPKHTPTKFKDVGARYEPPYLAAAVAAGTARPGSFEPATRVQPQIENALRNLPGADKFLPRWDKFQSDSQGSSRDIAERFANLRKITSTFSAASLRGKMDSLFTQGVSAQLKRRGLFTDEYLNVTVKAKPGPGRHLGQADGRSVKNSNETSPSLTSATTTERGWSAGLEGRVIIPGATTVANLGISPTVSPLQYSDTRTWKNSGGPTVTTTTGKGGSPDSQVFEHDVEFEVEITSYTRHRPWVRRLTPGSPFRVTPQVSTVAKTGDPDLPPISGKVDLWINDGTALTKDPSEFKPGKPGVISMTPNETPAIDDLLTQQQNQTAPNFLHVEAFANTEALRDEALRQLQRAAGGDAVLGLPGSEARARVDRMFSPENFRGLTPKLLKQGGTANGFRYERRVADRVGGLGMGVSLSNPKLVAVSETGGGDRTFSGGSKAGYEGTKKQSLEANVQLGLTVRPTGSDTHGQGQLFGTAKWSPWQRSSGSSHEITASVDHTNRSSSDSRTVLVQYDAKVRLIAESRQEGIVNGSISRAGADVQLPGSVFVSMTEDEARAEGLLPPVEPRTPAPGKLSAPSLVGGKSSSLGSAVLEDAPNLTKLVQDARQQLGKLGGTLLPKSVLDDSMNNLQRTLDTASPEAVTSLVDSALDGGVSLLAHDPGVLWTDNYQMLLKAKILDTQFVGVKHDGSEVDHVVNSTVTDKKNSGHGSSYGGQIRGAGRGLFQDSQPKVSGYDGAYLGASGTRAKSDQTVENKTITTALTSSSSGPSARYQHQVQFELVVARDGRTYPVASQEATVTSRSSADDQKISGNEQYHTKLYGSKTTELNAAESAPDRLEAWQREGFGPLPKSSTVEGIRGAADVRAAAIRALRLAGAGNGLTGPGTGAHNTLSSSITNETLQAHLPNMVSKPFETPDLHSSAVTGSSHASVKVYTRVVKPDLVGLSDSVKLERSDQTGSTFAGEAKETVTGEQLGNIGTGGITDPGRNTHSWGGLDVRGPVGQNDPTSSTAAAQRSVVGKDKGRTGLVGFDVEYRIVATVDGKTAAVEVRVPQSSRTRMSETDLEHSLGQPLPETLASAQDAVKKAAEDWRSAEEELEKAQRDFDEAWLSEKDNVRTTTDGARGLHLPVDGDPVQHLRQAVQTAQNDAREAGQALRAGNDEITRLNELDEQLLSLALGEEPGSVEQSDLVARAWDTQRQVQQIRNEQAQLVQQRQAAQDRAAEILAVLDEYRNNHTDHTARQDDANNRIQQAREKADEALRKWWQAKSEADNQIAAHAWPRPPENTPEQHREGTVEANDTVSGWDADTDRPYSFDPAEIQVRQITDSSGRVRAVSFLPANEHTESVERDWVAHNSGTVSTLPEGATPEKFDPLLKQASTAGAQPELSGRRFGEWADKTAAPWDDDSLFVFAHGREQSVKVTLLGGQTVRVDGDTFARIVAQAAPLAQSRSVTLIACSTGRTDGPGGLAHDFQRALRGLGGPSTVHAPTTPALFGRDSATLGQAVGATRGFTAVTDGGHFRTFGDPSAQSTTDSGPRGEEPRYSSPSELVSDLQRTAVNGPPPAPLLGPDLFGLYRAPEPPEFLRGHDFRHLTAGQGISFLDLLDLAKGYQLSREHLDPANLEDNRVWTLEKERPDDKLAAWAPGDVEPLAKTTSTPLLMHAIWLGGPLKDTGTMHAFRRNFGDAADRLGDGIVPVLWTDVPRWQTELALTTAAPEEGPDPLHDVRDLLRWAAEHRVQLINVDEVFTSEHPMRAQEFYLSELAKQTGPGFAAASDILRLELMHRFGGLYTDGDNVVHGLDDVVRAAESDAGYAVHRVGGNIANSAFTMAKGHPFAASYLDQLRENYGQTQANLMPREVDSLGQGFFATPMGRVHRQSVMYRTGPVAMTETARRIGLNSALELPGMTQIRMNSDHSWLLPPQGDPAPLADRFETRELTQRVIQTLVRGLHNRDGDLHLTAVEPAVRRHADPDLVWQAALSYIAADPELSALVRTVTDRSSYTGEVHDVPLPPAARALLTIDDSHVHYHLGEVQRAATLRAADAVLVADSPAPLENLISALRATNDPLPPIVVTGTGPDGRAHATAAARELAGNLADALGADVLDRVPVKIRVSEGDGQVRITFRPPTGAAVEMSTGTPTPRVFRGLDDGPAPATPRPWTHNGRTVGVHYSPPDVSVPNGQSVLTTDPAATRAFTEQLRTEGSDRPVDAAPVRLSAADHPTADFLLSDGTAETDLLLEELVRTATHRWWFRPTPPVGPIALSDRDGTAKLLGWVLAELGRGESAASLAEDVARHERPDLIWTAARELAALSPLHDDLAEQHAVLHLHGVTDTLLGKPDASAVLSDLAKSTRDGADVARIAEAVEVLDRHDALAPILNAPGGRSLLLEEISRLGDRPNPDGYARDLAAALHELAARNLPADTFRTALRTALDGPGTRPAPHRLSVVGLGWLDRWHTAAAIRRYQAEERAASARQAAELAELTEGSPRHA